MILNNLIYHFLDDSKLPLFHILLNYLKSLVFQGLPYSQIQAELEREGIDVLTYIYTQDKRVTWLRRFNKLYSMHLMKQTQVIDQMIETINELKG